MNTSFLPDPLHPALVHFPIVLIIVGAVVAVLALFLKGKAPAVTAAALLVAGTLAGWVALDTGGDAEDESHTDPKSVERHLIHEHEDAADWTMWMANPAAVLAVLAVILSFKAPDKRQLVRGAQIAAAVLGLLAASAVALTAKRGGALVYEHGVGIHAATGAVPAAAAVDAKHGDDD